MIWLSAVD